MPQRMKAEQRFTFSTLSGNIGSTDSERSLLRKFLFPPYHPTITRGNESKALSDLSRDFDTGGTPAVRVKYFWDFS